MANNILSQSSQRIGRKIQRAHRVSSVKLCVLSVFLNLFVFLCDKWLFDFAEKRY